MKDKVPLSGAKLKQIIIGQLDALGSNGFKANAVHATGIFVLPHSNVVLRAATPSLHLTYVIDVIGPRNNHGRSETKKPGSQQEGAKAGPPPLPPPAESMSAMVLRWGREALSKAKKVSREPLSTFGGGRGGGYGDAWTL